MELSCKLASNDTSNIGMISSDSKYVSIKISEQCLQNNNNKDRLNVPEDSDENDQDVCDSHDHMFYLFKKISELLLLVSGMSTVWENTNGCANK